MKDTSVVDFLFRKASYICKTCLFSCFKLFQPLSLFTIGALIQIQPRNIKILLIQIAQGVQLSRFHMVDLDGHIGV